MARFLNLNPLSSSALNLKVKTASNRRYVNKHLEKCSAQQQIDHSENMASPAGVSRGARISSLPEEIGNLSNRRFLRSDGNRKLLSLPIHVSRHFG